MNNSLFHKTVPAQWVITFDMAFRLAILSVLSLGVLVPILDCLNHTQTSATVSQFLSHTCHQIPSRCIHIFGKPMGICSRCAGVYCGIILIRMALQIDRQGFIYRRYLMNWIPSNSIIISVLLIQMVAEWILGGDGIIPSTILSRYVSGLLFGIGWILGPHFYLCRVIRCFAERWMLGYCRWRQALTIKRFKSLFLKRDLLFHH